MDTDLAKKIGLGALAVACPPVYVAQNEIRNEDYNTLAGRVAGTTAGSLFAAVACWLGTMLVEIPVIIYQDKHNATSTHWIAKDQNLIITHREAIAPSKGIALRQLIKTMTKTTDETIDEAKSKGIEIPI